MLWSIWDRFANSFGGEPVQARVWAVLIVVFPPCFDDVFGVAITGEDVFVQTFVTQAAIERFNEAILHWFAGGNRAPPYLQPSTPLD